MADLQDKPTTTILDDFLASYRENWIKAGPPDPIVTIAMVNEIERLRAEQTIHNTPAWEANERLNARVEICYQALERIIGAGPHACAAIAREALEEAQNVR